MSACMAGRAWAAAALMLMASTGSTWAAMEPFVGRVVSVHDGDTLTVLKDDRSTVKVRLAEVDAPECGQPWSRNAKRALSDLTFGKRVTVIPNATSYQRIVAWVTVGDPTVDVSTALVQQGQVWVYPQYLKRPALQSIEARNRTGRVGLWGMPASQRVAPWTWRHTGRPRSRSCDE